MFDAFATAEGRRRMNNALVVGNVTSVDRNAGTARVEFEDDWVSADLPWSEGSCGAFRTRYEPSVGEQVIVSCPAGDPAQGIITGRLASNATPLPEAAEGETVLGDWDDGARDSYHEPTSTRTIEIPAGGRLVLKVGASELVITDGSILLKSAAVDLGDEGGKAVGRIDDAISTSPPKIIAGATKVRAV